MKGSQTTLISSRSIFVFWSRLVLHLISLPVLLFFERLCTRLRQKTRRSEASVHLQTRNASLDAIRDISSLEMQHGLEESTDLQAQREQAHNDPVACFVVIVLVFLFQAYSTITAVFMKAVNCIEVDQHASEGHQDIDHNCHRHYMIETVSRVWVQDTSLYCYQGEHWVTGMAGGVGLSCSFLFILWIFFWVHANKHRLKNLVFIKRYGFLYQSYKEDGWGPYWEGVVFVRKALIQASVVFAIPLGPNLQSTTALGVLIVAFALHWIERPFREYKDHPNVPEYSGKCLDHFLPARISNAWRSALGAVSLNGLEAASMLVSISVFYTGIVSNDPNASEGAKMCVAACTFAINVLFVVYMLHRLYAGAHLVLDMYIVYLECQEHDEASGQMTERMDTGAPEGGGLVSFYKKCFWIRSYVVQNQEVIRRREKRIQASFAMRTMLPIREED